MPLKATLKSLSGKEDVLDAILFLKFDDSGKIIHWQEVYAITFSENTSLHSESSLSKRF